MSKPLRLLVDGRAVSGRQGGVARVITRIVAALAPYDDIRVRVLNNFPEAWTGMDHVEISSFSMPSNPGLENEFFWEQTTMRTIVKRHKPDVFWSPWNIGVPLGLNVPLILTVHDIIPLRHPNPLGSRYRSALYRLSLRQSLYSADAILTPSEFTRQDLAERCGVYAHSIGVIPWGVEEHFHPSEPKELKPDTQPYRLLYVGGHERRKNVATLLEALALLQREHPSLPVELHMTGTKDHLHATSVEAMRQLEDASAVRMLGYLDDHQLPDVYRSADLFVFPSVEEGFGFPPLEAMASGVPVICGAFDSIPEVVGPAAHITDVTNARNLASCMAELLGDRAEREKLHRLGLSRAGRFRWQRTAEHFAAVVRSV
ncbi:MAG: glycosyltransferase family 4 protein [Gammaproteobacteria bacterium]